MNNNNYNSRRSSSTCSSSGSGSRIMQLPRSSGRREIESGSGASAIKMEVSFANLGKYLLKKRRALRKKQKKEDEDDERNLLKNTKNDHNVNADADDGGGDSSNEDEDDDEDDDEGDDEDDGDKDEEEEEDGDDTPTPTLAQWFNKNKKPDSITNRNSSNTTTTSINTNYLKESRKSLLAGSRTPSFNVMLRANDYYKESGTIKTRSVMRITWDDLEEQDNINFEEEQQQNNNALNSNSCIRSISIKSLGNNSSSSNSDDDDGGHGHDDDNDNDSSYQNSNGIDPNSSRSTGMFQLRRKDNSARTSALCIKPSESERSMWSSTASIQLYPDFSKFVLNEKIKEWLKAFVTCDPRYKILKFFNDVANEGATGDSKSINNFKRDHISPLLKFFNRSSVFTVWRPTSMDAIRRMMTGEGVGKGLDIKGKSAKCGILSALVPFLQINKEEHKVKVRTLRKDSKIRIFFNTKKDRNTVVTKLNALALELQQTVKEAKEISNSKRDLNLYDETTTENAMEKLILDMDDTTIDIIDTYAITDNKYGIAVQERLFWEGMVTRQNITRQIGTPNYTGRTSMPSFQDMNFTSLRAKSAGILGDENTRAVIMQYRPPSDNDGNNNDDDDDDDDYDPMCPINLVMAYEENNPNIQRLRVIPCVSDFDCFMVGSRGVKYKEQVPEDQLDILKWGVNETEKILANEGTDSWTERWLDGLKECASKGFQPKIPPGGYSDPKTQFIFDHAIERLSSTGCVRHGAECFNYYFPQELDDKLLVISDELPEKYEGRNWAYVDQFDLQEILLEKIKVGYTFPLNPKWILCDPGWKNVYNQLMKSNRPNVQDSLQCWYPRESGIRERIDDVYNQYPNGFKRLETNINDDEFKALSFEQRRSTRLSHVDGTAAMDLAELELKHYLIFQRARRRLKAILILKRMLEGIRKEKKLKGEREEVQQEENIIKEDLHHEDEEHERSNDNNTVTREVSAPAVSLTNK